MPDLTVDSSAPPEGGCVITRLEAVIPDESCNAGRGPWFDRLTTLSEVEGESSEI